MKLAIKSLFLLPFMFAAAPSVLADTTTCTKLIASGNSEYPPYLWKNADNNKLNGAISLLVADLSKDLGIEIDLVYSGPWGRVQEEVAAGRVDMIAGAFFTTPRTKYMDYLYPEFQKTRTAVWYNQNKPFNFAVWDDLKAHQGVTVINNSFGEKFDEYAKKQLSISQVASLEQALQMLSGSRVDYLIYEDNPGQAYAQKAQITNIGTQEVSVTEENLYVTLSKKSVCNTNKVKEDIANLLSKYQLDGRMNGYLNTALEMWSAQSN